MPTRIAFIGSGGMANAHTGAMASMRGVKFAAFCDVNKERGQVIADKYEADFFTDPGKMIATAEPAAVWICLPPFAHGAAERACIKHNVPFFTEKPINKDLRQARQIAKAVAEAKLLTCAGYMNRYRKGINKAKQMLEKDPAIYVQGGWIGGSPPPKATSPIGSWWVQKDLSGGQFVEQVTHTVDLVRYLCGDATEVAAFAAQGFNQGIANYTIDDAMAVSIKFESGAVANLHSCCASNAKGGVTLSVFAKNSAFELTGWDHGMNMHAPGKQPRTIPGEPDIFAVEDRAFLKAVRTGDASGIKSTYADAVKTLEITLAANQSAEKGRVVKLAKD